MHSSQESAHFHAFIGLTLYVSKPFDKWDRFWGSLARFHHGFCLRPFRPLDCGSNVSSIPGTPSSVPLMAASVMGGEIRKVNGSGFSLAPHDARVGPIAADTKGSRPSVRARPHLGSRSEVFFAQRGAGLFQASFLCLDPPCSPPPLLSTPPGGELLPSSATMT